VNDRVYLPAVWALAVALSLMSMLVSVAHATDATITCAAPTKYDDGTAIPAGSIFTYAIYGALQGQPKLKRASSNVCNFLRTNLTAGTQEWYVTATLDGMESVPSVTVSKVVEATDPTPSPALVTSGPYSYALGGTTAAPTMSAIGLIVSGLPCGPATKTVGTVKFCQITRAQTDLIGWPVDKTLASGVWAKAAP
jgi:hypothetical protein